MIFLKSDEVARKEINQIFGGSKTVTMVQLLQPEQMFNRGRLFNRVILPPGASLGLHKHDGESEFYYILSGKGRYQHDNEFFEVHPGDVVSVDNHHSHAILNIGDETLEFIALILFADDHEN